MTLRIGKNGVSGKLITEDIEERLQNRAMKRIFKRFKKLADNPEAYTKPSKIRGGGRHGAIENDPGYKSHIKVALTDRGFTVVSSRPYLPGLDFKWIKERAQDLLDFVMRGNRGG